MSDGTAIVIALIAAVVILRLAEAKSQGGENAGRGIVRELEDQILGRPRAEF